MLYFLITYAGTIAGIATTVGGALWAFAKFGGKTVLEQWLKRNYKEWELNTEKPYKEDFKRFEDKLDRLASRDETKFNYLHPERSKAAMEIHSACLSLIDSVSYFMMLNSIDLSIRGQQRIDESNNYVPRVYGALSKIDYLLAASKPYFSQALTKPIFDFTELAATILRDGEVFNDADQRENRGKLVQSLRIIERELKVMLGTEIDLRSSGVTT